MKEKVSLPWNPQPNSILERIHQILAGCLRTFELEDKEIDINEADPFAEYLAQAAYAKGVASMLHMVDLQVNWSLEGTCSYQWNHQWIGKS